MKKLGLVVGIMALVGCSTVGEKSDTDTGTDTATGGGPEKTEARFFLPTDGQPHNTSAPTVEVDAKTGKIVRAFCG